MSTTKPTTPPPDRLALQYRLYGANVLTVLSKAPAIMVAKTFNAAITQSITPDTACSESPKGTWSGFFIQLLFVLVAALLVLKTWFRHAHAQMLKDNYTTFWAKTWDIRKFAAGEVLGWATKELTAIGVALMAVGVGYVHPPDDDEEGRRVRLLRDALQGDSPLTGVIENDWKQVAAYAIYAVIMLVVTFLVFVPGMGYLQTLVRHKYNLLRKTLLGHSTTFTRQDAASTIFLEKEKTDDLAVELATEANKVPLAYTINGTVSGMIAVAIFSTNDGDPNNFSWGAFGLLETYTAVLLYLGGYIFSHNFFPESLDKLADFYKDVWGCLTGLALGSIATSPGGVLSGLDDHMDGTAADALRATVVSLLALIFLLHGAHIRIYESFCPCTPRFRREMAEQTAQFFITASSLAFAWAWEDFSNDVVCEELPKVGISGVGAVWTNFAIVAAVMIPISIFFSLQAQKVMGPVQDDLDALFGKKKSTDAGTTPPPEAAPTRTEDEPVMDYMEDVEEVVEV